MLERGQDARLLGEALAFAIFIRAQKLHADLQVRNHVARAIHLAHATGRNDILQPETAANESRSILSSAVPPTGAHSFHYAPVPRLR